MKTLIFTLLGLCLGVFLRAQQPMPTQAFVPQSAHLVTSFRYNQLKTQNSNQNLRNWPFMRRLGAWVAADIFNEPNDSLFFSYCENPAVIGVDTNQLFHLASFRDTAGVLFYTLTMPVANLGEWKKFISKSLPRFRDREFRLTAGNFFIMREDHAFIWTKNRIVVVIMRLPPYLKPSWAQKMIYFENYLTAEYLNLSAAGSLHNLPAYNQIIADKNADFYLYFNPKSQFIQYPTAASCVLNNNQLTIKTISAPPTPLANLLAKKGNFPAARFASLLKNTNAAATFWAFFNSKTELSKTVNFNFFAAVEYLKISPYAVGKNTKTLDTLAQNAFLQNAFAALNGHLLVKVLDFKHRAGDSLLLPVVEMGLDFEPKNKPLLDLALAELCRKNVLKLETPPNLLFSYQYDKNWTWHIGVEKNMIYISTQDKNRPLLNKASKKNPVLLTNNNNLLEINPTVFGEKLAVLLDKNNPLLPVLKLVQTNVVSFNLYSQPAQNGLINQNIELKFNENFKFKWSDLFTFL